MLSLQPNALTKRENYHLLSTTIVPRPIAFVTSLSDSGVLNGAPFSFFNVVSAEPPLISISIGRKNGVKKDTARNILDNEEFVVHVTDETNVIGVNRTAANLPPDESEISLVDFNRVESTVVKVPGIAESPVRIECKLEKHLVFQEGETMTDFIIGRVVHYHIKEDMYVDGKVNPSEMKPVGRLGGAEYSKIGEVFELQRPK
ncbi:MULTISPECIES: flavin reductase family protein [Bacillaceae]|uniref:Flavin reductase family protein n=1 Tax=Evansella alkalicola TaxID=745819 RepID=A0ABS6JPT2_9BACI|nr:MULTISPECIES: flavin reductase family protein [Bacillaceae]MBU9720106.1 flavin reductase family protein [Bacillus alkalicola]